jgi:deoxyribodipyrimidine photolyase-related protein
MDLLLEALKQEKITKLKYFDVCDDWLQRRLTDVFSTLDSEVRRYESPSFLTSLGQIEDYFDSHPDRMQHFYEWQRKRLDILMEGSKPKGGKWSYDHANRKKLPKNITLPEEYTFSSNKYIDDAKEWVEKEFNNNPGSTDTFAYPITHKESLDRLETFLKERFEQFGPYEDAIAKDHSQLFHSVISPLLNIGLLTPDDVVAKTLSYADKHNVPIESVEGFIRQIIGWREYMRATYVHYGREMRTTNKLKYSRKLDSSWWDGSVGLEPIDTTIKRVLKTGYAHHIERLMILGNALLLLRVDPDDVYEWFMSLFIDAYDWVMVPNVYAMSQFAAGEKITTKPYVSGSNYIIKMSDYKKDEWAEQWDALYWQFIADNKSLFESNFRSAMMVKLYDKKSASDKKHISEISKKWL